MEARRKRDHGYTAAYVKGGEACCALDPAEYPALLDAWMRGAAFFTGRDFHGDEITVKLGQIEAVLLNTPEGMAASRAENDAERSDDALGITA